MAADMCPTWTGTPVPAAAADGAADTDMAAADHEQQQQLEGGVGLGGKYEVLMGSVSYDRTIKVWAPEEGLRDLLASDSSSSGSGDEEGSEDSGNEGDGRHGGAAMDLG